jgi:hypothetical protein
MNLQPVKQQPAHRGHAITMYCIRCSHGTTDALADLADKPGTYYCPPCAKEITA